MTDVSYVEGGHKHEAEWTWEHLKPIVNFIKSPPHKVEEHNPESTLIPAYKTEIPGIKMSMTPGNVGAEMYKIIMERGREVVWFKIFNPDFRDPDGTRPELGDYLFMQEDKEGDQLFSFPEEDRYVERGSVKDSFVYGIENPKHVIFHFPSDIQVEDGKEYKTVSGTGMRKSLPAVRAHLRSRLNYIGKEIKEYKESQQ